MESTIIHSISPDQLQGLFNSLQSQIQEIKSNFKPSEQIEYLTRAEVAKILKCDLSTVHNWTVKGKIKAYGLGGRVYYKRSEIESVLVPINQ